MKSLYLLRHAQAMPSDHGEDKERPLTPKGLGDAAALGKEMKRKLYIPHLVLCSTAARTMQTAEQILSAFDGEAIKVQYLDDLYDASRGDIFDLIQKRNEAHERVMIVGHNPAIYELSVTLSANGSESLISRLMQGFKPATAAIIECPCHDWLHFQPGNNTITDVLDPLDYNAPATPARWT